MLSKNSYVKPKKWENMLQHLYAFKRIELYMLIDSGSLPERKQASSQENGELAEYFLELLNMDTVESFRGLCHLFLKRIV